MIDIIMLVSLVAAVIVVAAVLSPRIKENCDHEVTAEHEDCFHCGKCGWNAK